MSKQNDTNRRVPVQRPNNQLPAKRTPDVQAGFDIQVGKVNVTILFGFSEGKSKGGSRR